MEYLHDLADESWVRFVSIMSSSLSWHLQIRRSQLVMENLTLSSDEKILDGLVSLCCHSL